MGGSDGEAARGVSIHFATPALWWPTLPTSGEGVKPRLMFMRCLPAELPPPTWPQGGDDALCPAPPAARRHGREPGQAFAGFDKVIGFDLAAPRPMSPIAMAR